MGEFSEVVVEVVGGKEGGVGGTEGVRAAPPRATPHELGHTNPSPRMYPNTSDGILSDPPRVVPYILLLAPSYRSSIGVCRHVCAGQHRQAPGTAVWAARETCSRQILQRGSRLFLSHCQNFLKIISTKTFLFGKKFVKNVH